MVNDAVKADPGHYQVEFQNKRVRVVRVKYAAHEKSVMHSHPALLAVFLSDGQIRFTYPDGKSEEVAVTAGSVQAFPPQVHLPESLTDRPFEALLIELKPGAAAAKSKRAKPAKAKSAKAGRTKRRK
jgi:quercetin dioxygenase-like cupin family protein